MYPGRFEEQPMPLIVMTLYGGISRSAIACLSAARTPKSPQPGHQSGSTFPFSSLTVIFAPSNRGVVPPRARTSVSTIAMFSSSDLDLVHGHVLRRRACQNRFHAVDNVMRHERFAIVFPDMTVGRDAGFRSQVTRELAAVVIFHDNDFLAFREHSDDRVGVERHEPLDLQVVGGNACASQLLRRFANDSFRRSPANYRHLSVARAIELGRRQQRQNTFHL